MKKLFSIILCGIVLLGCCSCAGKTSGQSSAAASSNTAAANASATASAPSANTSANNLLDSENPCEVAGYMMGSPNPDLGWRAGGGTGYFSENLKKSNMYSNEDMFLCSNGCTAKDGQVKPCSNLDGAINSCWVDMQNSIILGVNTLYSSAMKQTVETKKQVKVNSYDMLKVTGMFNDSHENTSSYYVAFYVVVPADKLVNTPHPIYWVFFSGLKDNVPTLEKYADAMAQSLKPDKDLL